ncbi:hypothetical protein GCM10023168_33960 [Fodinibacter luteus]|uniref:DUF998 domain-containing protein n=1 Tax=Fodinibacter luteus TaxID=552064 RepID=A0ABP8KP58_9MICO
MSKPLTALALLGAAGITTTALTDAVTVALTGEPSFASDEHGVTAPFVLSGLVHVGAYVTFATVLHSWRAQIDGASRFRRAVRVVLTITLAVLALTLLIGTGVAVATGEVPDNAVFEAVAGIAFLLMFVASLALGITLLRRPQLRLAARTLTGIIAALGLTILLGATGSPWAHPAYVEVLAAFGLAFVALAPRHVHEADETTDVEPTTHQPRPARNPA